MANLETIKQLNTRFGKSSPISAIETFSPNLLENFNISLKSDRDHLQKALDNIGAKLGPRYLGYFELGLPAEVALLFIDVCSFSTRFANLSGEEIADFFDAYYEIVIPIIYRHNGEIDKIMGDGIICTFGPPFMDKPFKECLRAANDCSREILEATSTIKFRSKIAFHSGKVNYYKNKSVFYNEYTMVGKPLTELFRLESISEDLAINFFSGTEVENFYSDSIQFQRRLELANIKLNPGNYKYHNAPVSGIKGVNYLSRYYVKKIIA